MTPEQMIAAAKASHSPALEALVIGHLQAGRPGMAAMALRLDVDSLAILDRALEDAKDAAAVLGIATARGLD